MHPTHNLERRKARAKALLQDIDQHKQQAVFVDAAWVKNKDAYTSVVVDTQGNIRDAITVYTKDPTVAEQVAIALAIRANRWTHIYSDSRTAIRNFTNGYVTRIATKLLDKVNSERIEIRWFPAHLGVVDGTRRNLNEVANEAARGLSSRALQDRAAYTSHGEHRDRLLTYNEITKHYYLSRREYPLPHGKLCRAQAVTLRLLQTRTYPSPDFINRIYPEREIQTNCNKCNGIITLDHMLWQCPAVFADCDKEQEWWRQMLRSESLSDQLRAVQKARDVAEGLGLTVPTWERPASTQG